MHGGRAHGARPPAPAAPPFSPEDVVALQEEIRRLARERNAVILAHNYQLPEVQDVADFVGDSLALSRQAAATDAGTIVFCGVHFMAETAAILCPEKTVLLPDLEAGCSLAESITAEELRAWKAEHPGAVVVAYVNTSAEVKALADICCTSTNAVRVIQSIPEDREILFLPDLFLGSYVARVTGRRNIHVWTGECHVHAGITPDRIATLLERYPDAEFLVHPECGCSTSCMYLAATGDVPGERVRILSTDGMIRHVEHSRAHRFVVATETGILHRLRRRRPDGEFIPADPDAVCRYMKRITLDKVARSLREGIHRITVPEDVARAARRAIERMLEIG